MAKNIIGADSKTVVRTAPVGGVVSGDPFILGSEALIPLSTVAEGVAVTCVIEGLVYLPFKSGDTWTQGAKVYWEPTTGGGRCEDSDTSTNYLIGTYDGSYNATNIRVAWDGKQLPAAGGDLEEKANKTDLASTANGKGASTIGIEDAGTKYTATTVEAALAEVKTIADAAAVAADLASVANGKGASLIGIEDASALLDATTVEDAIIEVYEAASKRIEIAIVGLPNGALDLSYTLPPDAMVQYVGLQVTAAAAGGVTVDVGVNGDTDAYLNDVDAASLGYTDIRPTVVAGVLTACKGGASLVTFAAGADADDRGLYVQHPDIASGGLKLAIAGSAADAAFRGTLYVVLNG